MTRYYRANANVDLNAIRHNIIETKKLVTLKTKVMLIIKSDAYGHGAVCVCKDIEEEVDCFGVAIIDEAIELREAKIKKPILALGYAAEEEYEKIVRYDVTQTIIDYKMAKGLNEIAKSYNKTVNIHIKIDTGMSRLGMEACYNTLMEIKEISKLTNLKIEGIFSHFSGSALEEKTSARKQLKKFKEFITKLEEEGIDIPIKHMSNSGGTIDIPEANLDMIRCGIMAYGIYPSDFVKKTEINLKPAMELKSHVYLVKEVPENTGISYENTYITKRKTKIATIGIGYGDGYPWALSNKGRVIINGKYAPILGKVCMDQFMVDVTDIDNVKQGDTVILMGESGESKISVEELAIDSGSMPYEILCNINKRVPRTYTF